MVNLTGRVNFLCHTFLICVYFHFYLAGCVESSAEYDDVYGESVDQNGNETGILLELMENQFELLEDNENSVTEPSLEVSNEAMIDEADSITEQIVEEADNPPLRDDATSTWPWHVQARYAIDGYSLSQYFRTIGYTPPSGSEILIGRVVEGVGQPAYILYDISGSAFSFSFWPASTIKVLACLGALDFLAELGMSGNALITMFYDDGTTYSGRVRDIYTAAISVSSNADYDRCVEIAGFDRLNTVFLSPERDLPATVIQRRYGYRGSLRVSPYMELSEGGVTVTVPRREGTGDYGCPPEGNCANLFELINSLRRVVLHSEIPAHERFTVTTQDVENMNSALLDSRCYFESAAIAVFGTGVEIYNKTGYVPGDDILDHGVVVDPATSDRYLVAVSVPDSSNPYGELSTFVEQALLAVYSFDIENAMPWQYDSGIPIRVQLDDEGIVNGKRRIHFTIEAIGANRIKLWTDTWLLGETTGGPRFNFSYDYMRGGERMLVLKAWFGEEAVGYRAMAVYIPPP